MTAEQVPADYRIAVPDSWFCVPLEPGERAPASPRIGTMNIQAARSVFIARYVRLIGIVRPVWPGQMQPTAPNLCPCA
jgi:hypothetical protein